MERAIIIFLKKKILAITLARGGSKGVKNKNIRTLNNKPLISYTISEALKSKYIDHYIVSTDSEEIKKISQKFGADVPFLRPKYLSKDNSTSSDALMHAVKFAENKNNIKYDAIIELMCTNPLKKYYDIDKCIIKLIKTKSDSVIAMMKVEEFHPRRLKFVKNDKIINIMPEKIESRRQDLKPEVFIRAGSIYALDRNYFIKTKKRYGSKNSRPYILPKSRSINIDSENDLLIAKKLLMR